MNAGISKRGKRSPEYFVEQIVNLESADLSGFCREARAIYKIWFEGGADELREYLENSLEIPAGDAVLIAKSYSPQEAPVEICPIFIDSVMSEQEYSKIFDTLALRIDDLWPKYILAWYLKKYLLGREVFDFEVIGSGGYVRDGKGFYQDNKIQFYSTVVAADGNDMPFGLAALDILKVGELPASIIKKGDLLVQELGEVGRDLAKTLYEANMIFPPKRALNKIIEIVKAGLTGRQIVLAGIFCPDYSYREVNDPKRPGVEYGYTFDRLNDGIGLVAKQIQRIIPFLTEFFARHQIEYRVSMSIADFEGNQPAILEKVGLSREEFISRCRSSLMTFGAAFPDIEIELNLFEEGIVNGDFATIIQGVRDRMAKGDFGQIQEMVGKEPKNIISFIAKNSLSFYKRWFDKPDMSIDEAKDLVLAQGAEYAASGIVWGKYFQDDLVIQIAGDRPKMQAFNSFESSQPVICCKRVY